MPGKSGNVDITAKHRIFQGPVEVSDGSGQFLKRPALTTAQRNAIGTPRAGMGIFNLDTLQEEFYDGTIWKQSAGGGGPTLVVAASDALASTIARADYQCDGTADDIEINLVLTVCAAGPGGKVILSEGTFNCIANITVPADCVLEGSGFNTIINFDDGGAGTVTNIGAIVVGGDNVKICDLKAQLAAGCGAGGSRPNVIYSNGRDHMLIGNVWLVGDTSVADDGSVTRQNGIYLTGNGTENKIVNCNVDGCDRHGICVRNTSNSLINGNTSNSNTQNGIYLESVTYCVIADNTAHDNTTGGIYMATSTRNTITGNSAEANTSVGIYLHTSHNNTVSGNNCFGNAGEIRIETSHENVITGNTCTGGTAYGIFIYRGDYNTISGNTCCDNATDGINLFGDGVRNADYNVISGNVCTGNTDDGIDIIGGADANRNVVIGNEVTGNGGTAIEDAGNETAIKNNEGIVGFGDDKGATLTVATSDSLQPGNADYICDGVADNVQIQAAIDALSAVGGRVLLLEGTYALAADITLDGEGQVLEGQGNSTILNFGGAAIANAITITANDVKVANLKAALVAGAGAGGTRPNVIYASSVDRLVLDSLWIVGDTSVADDGSQLRQNGIYLTNSDEDRVVNCRLEDNDRAGIYIRNSNNGLISDNVIQGNTQQGIRGQGCQHMTVSGNSVLDNTGSGMFLAAFSFCTMSGNTVEGNGSVGIYLHGTINATVSDNTCHINGSSNIRVEGGNENVITGNQACACPDGAGILIYRSSYNVVSGNGCNDNAADGIAVTGDGVANADYNSLTGNVCTGNTDDGIDITGGADANKNTIVSCQLLGNGTALEDGGVGTETGHNITA